MDKIADGWIQTRVFWSQKRPVCQICHKVLAKKILYVRDNVFLVKRKMLITQLIYPKDISSTDIPFNSQFL